MPAWYNEHDPKAAAWLRELIAQDLIAPGIVDERSIVDVQPRDLDGFTQCHFFAGIGGWSLALRLAMWPDDRPVWTGSCPCQPFSAAGKRKGAADERHLWPEFHRLIAECAPPVVFGEQVASKDGRTWLAGVRTDLEALGYGVGAADLCAAGVGAPHIRQRLWWLANNNSRQSRIEDGGLQRQPVHDADGCGELGRMADADGGFACDGGLQRGGQHGQQPQDGRSGGLGDADRTGTTRLGEHGRHPKAAEGLRDGHCCPGGTHRLGDDDARLAVGSLEDDGRRALRVQRPPAGPPGPYGPWSRYDIVHCTDGKARRFEPGSFPLAHGVSNRVGRLRGYGNAIVPQVAAEFIAAADEAMRRP
jgi:DNA (cytosine-5)-methyltransferase 1